MGTERIIQAKSTPSSASEKLPQGLDIAQDFFNEWGRPYLKRYHPDLVHRLTALLCFGSDTLGNDDALSRDHNWGPRFLILLTGDDMKHHGRKLQKQLSQSAPREWKGYNCRVANNTPVESINRWFKRTAGCSHPPKTDRGWIERTKEEHLYMIRHATVFYDPLGEFSERRQSFWFYPQQVWLERISLELFNVWHFGQYNFLDRLTHRNDPVASTICLGRFAEGVMRLLMLLSHDYSPYWKWLAAEFRKVSGVEQLDAWLVKLTETKTLNTQIELVRSICDEVHARLVLEFDVDPEPKGHPHPLLCARGEIEKIKDGIDRS